MLLGIHHIGLAVRNLDEGIKVYFRVLGIKPSQVHQVPQVGMRAAIYSLGGVEFELMEPIGTEGPLAKFIETRGEGIHHICLQVDDIDKELKRLSAEGVKLVDTEARQGLEGRVAFIHPKATGGVLIELLQKAPASTSNRAVSNGEG